MEEGLCRGEGDDPAPGGPNGLRPGTAHLLPRPQEVQRANPAPPARGVFPGGGDEVVAVELAGWLLQQPGVVRAQAAMIPGKSDSLQRATELAKSCRACACRA